ncbi:MAG: hypothetical protein M1836_004881 [Candelina mexicana]|nr:MAG: hypothetical protein M1836_004881 [Candelina mexicana]
MAEQPDITSILAALAAQRPNGTPSQQPGLPQGYSNLLSTSTPPASLGGYTLPQPSNSGSLDLSGIKPVNSGSVSIAEAIAKARGIAAQKGVAFDQGRIGGVPNREGDPRLGGRPYRRSRSRSRSPPPIRRDNFRDNYNPYRDERRDDRRGDSTRDFGRERSFSPGQRARQTGNTFSPPPNRSYGGRGDRSPARGAAGDSDNVETIMIDSGLVGLIIGRQGENLRRVETDTGTRVQFITGPDATGPTRHCKITGSRAARADAKAEIYRIIDENGSGPRTGPSQQLDRAARGVSTGGSKGVTFGNQHQPALREGEDSMQIMVPDRTVGLIIGRGGETIRDLQERSGCHVNIVGEQKSVNGLRPVNLIGSPQAAAMAKELIMEIVDSDTKSLANQGSSQREPARTASYGAYGGAGDNYGGGGDKINDTILVPSEAVGMIIGKGGETIKDMQNSTGCKINVSAASGPNDFEREIGLVGSRGSIEQAKNAIMEKVDAVQQKNRGGGGGGGARQSDPYSDRDRYSHVQQSYSQQSPNQSSQGHNPATSAAAPPGDTSDPYAAYGGYQNYVAMWYAAMAQQQQQQQQQQGGGQGEQQKPPGTA